MLPSARSVLLTLFSCLFSSLVPALAVAQQTPYCKQVRARAASDADYLMTPRVIVQGLHFPNGSELADSGPVLGSGYQLRTGLTFSPVDFYKGRGVVRAGDADCKRHEAGVALDDALGHSTESARLSALLQQGEFLRGHTEDWRNISARAAARLSQRIITVVDFNSVQRSIDTLEHKLVQVEGEAEQLKARQLRVSGMLPSGKGLGSTPATDTPAVPELASEYFRQSMRYERETSGVRQMEDWKLQITGGVIPLYPVDWYGTVELSFSLGALVRGQHEERYIEGRSEDLRYARDGVETRLAQFRAQTSAALEQARRDLGLVDHSLEVLRATRLALEQSESESAAQARDLISIEQVSVESDSVFLRSFVGALETLMARARG